MNFLEYKFVSLALRKCEQMFRGNPPRITLDTLKKRLDAVGLYQMSEHRVKYDSARTFLQDAFNLPMGYCRQEALRSANELLVYLMNLPEKEMAAGREVDNRQYIGLGYYGRVVYFSMQNNWDYAVRHIYQCAAKHPLVAALTFDECYFEGCEVQRIRDLFAVRTDIRKHSFEEQVRMLRALKTLPPKLVRLQSFAKHQLQSCDQYLETGKEVVK